jgi:NAD(P)-dependent dehydrogenase (short-subunit alcohol dehydrogenase family)
VKKYQGTVLITGCAKRLGKSLALFLAQKDYKIAIHYNTSEEDALNLQAQIGKAGKIYPADLNYPDQAAELIEKVFTDFPDLKLLINNASYFKKKALAETDIELLKETFNVNFFSPYLLIKQFALTCKQGNIINILDTKINSNQSLYSAYTLSKQALYHLTLQAALEFAPEIRVNAIAPGSILAPDDKQDFDYLKNLVNKTPLKKTGSKADIAHCVDYILANDYITGQVFNLDGGYHLK